MKPGLPGVLIWDQCSKGFPGGGRAAGSGVRTSSTGRYVEMRHLRAAKVTEPEGVSLM